MLNAQTPPIKKKVVEKALQKLSEELQFTGSPHDLSVKIATDKQVYELFNRILKKEIEKGN